MPSPLTLAKRAVCEGLKTRSETVPGGPTGGVVWLRAMWRRPPRGLRPLAWSVEKQDTPATAPPLRTQAVDVSEWRVEEEVSADLSSSEESMLAFVGIPLLCWPGCRRGWDVGDRPC